jgi:hypothetical protein
VTNLDIEERALMRRAVEAVIWSLPAVNFDLMQQAMIRAGGASNQIVYWPRLLDWKNQTLTPNPDSICLMPFFDTRAGPVVLEIPPAGDDGLINGSVDGCWQTPIEDVGPAGVDKGAGGKYLLLPPDHDGEVSEGYIPMPCETYTSYALLRSLLNSGSDADVAQAVAYGRRIRVYPLSQADDPPATVFVDASDVVFDATIPYDRRFFESLDRVIQREPWLPRDRAMIDITRTVGIKQGELFAPTEEQLVTLDHAAKEAHAWLDEQYESFYQPTYWETSRWALPVAEEMVRELPAGFPSPDAYPVDARGTSYSFAFFAAKHFGTGQFYLFDIKDADGKAFSGAKHYRLSVPPDVPISQYWSVTLYDRATHALIRDVSHASRSSQSPGLVTEPDGTVNLYFGPVAPDGHESNWIPTGVKGDFEELFRFYGPKPPLYDKTWQLPDVQSVE